MEMNCCCCEWLNRLITVNRGSRIIATQRLIQTHANSRRYGLQLLREIQHLPEFNKCLTCKNILDSYTGWRAPHLLVVAGKPQHGNLITHGLLVCDASGSFEPCGLEFAVKRSDLPSSGGCYHLLDGPTVVWQRGTCVHIVHGESMERDSVDLTKVALHIKMAKIENIWCISSTDEDGHSSILLLVQLQLRDADFQGEFGNLDFICLQVRLREDSLLCSSGVKVVQVANVIPSDYGCMATCVASHKRFPIEGGSGAMLEGVVFLVGTKYQQVVLCEEGTVTHVIPLQDIPKHVVTVKGCGGDMEIAVVSESGSTCVYDVMDTRHKLKGRWDNATDCLAGDFAQLGNKQLLILDDTVNSNKILHLTEGNILSTTSSADEMEGDMEETLQSPPESLLSALRAVQLKRNTEAARLTHHKLTLKHKSDLLSRSLRFMESLGKKSAPSDGARADPGLVCLVPGKLLGEAASQGVSADSPDDESAKIRLAREEKGTSDLAVLRVWQRVSGGKWVAGILLKNNSGRMLTGVGASILVKSCDPSPKESSCRVVWSERSRSASQVPPSSAEPVAAASQVPPNVAEPAAADAPPSKRRRLELLTPALDCSDRTHDQCDLEPIQHDHAFCLGVATEERSLGAPATIVAFWWKDGTEGPCSEELAQIQLTVKSIRGGELSIDERCLSLWDGTLALAADAKFYTKEAQDLACLLATQSLTQVQLSASYTHLSRIPSMIRARLPLTEHTLQLAGGSFPSHHHHLTTPSSTNKGACAVLEGTALHIRLQLKTAVVSILHKSQSHLELVLRLLKSSLPCDIQYSLVACTEEWKRRALLQSLEAIREETADRARRLNTTLEELMETGEGETMPLTMQGDPRLGVLTDTKIKAL